MLHVYACLRIVMFPKTFFFAFVLGAGVLRKVPRFDDDEGFKDDALGTWLLGFGRRQWYSGRC